MNRDRAIGVFDSGIGGLTVLSSLLQQLPGEDYVYFGDTARVPYGNKTPETIIYYTRQIVHFLLQKNIKALVIACNTVSSTGLQAIKEMTDIPVFEVISPPASTAIQVTRNKKIGVIGTTRTISSCSYQNILHSYCENVEVWARSTPLFVPLVEENILGRPLTQQVIDYYLSEWKNNVDTLLLGCTHYPLLIDDFNEYFDGNVRIVDSAGEVAIHVRNFVEREQLLKSSEKGTVEYIVSDPAGEFIQFARKIIGCDISGCCKKVDLSEKKE